MAKVTKVEKEEKKEDKFRYNIDRTLLRIDGTEYTTDHFRTMRDKAKRYDTQKPMEKSEIKEVRVKEAVMVPVAEPVDAFNVLKNYFRGIGGRPMRIVDMSLKQVKAELEKLGLL